jgi:hypothetical protein
MARLIDPIMLGLLINSQRGDEADKPRQAKCEET